MFGVRDGILCDKISLTCTYAIKCQNSLSLSLASNKEEMQTLQIMKGKYRVPECHVFPTGSCNRCFKVRQEDT